MKAAILSLVVNRKSLIAFFLSSLFIILYSLFIILASPAHAQYCDPDPNISMREAVDKLNKCAIEKDVFDDKLFNLNQIAGTADALNNLLTGYSQLHPDTNNSTAGSGALAASAKLVASLYAAPPASGVQFFAGEFQKFNPIKPAYAQTPGVGFDTLRPVQGIWRVFRNIAYSGFVVVFVILGFMIMFRSRLSPQTVATVQDSIPRLVVALILVTFSYAIAGLMIDLMFLGLNIAINTLQGAGLLTGTADRILKQNIFGVIWSGWDDTVGATFNAVNDMLKSIIDLPGGFDKLIGTFGGSISGLIIGIAVLFIMFRIFLMLLMAYVMIIILTMAAPFYFLVQALPGNNGAREWFKQMAANVSVFPTVALMVIFAAILANLTDLGAAGSIPIDANRDVGQFPLFVGGIPIEAVSKIIGIGILLMTPNAANIVKEALGARGGVGAGLGGAMAAVGAGAGVLGAVPRGAGGAAFREVGSRLQEGFGRNLASRGFGVLRRGYEEKTDRPDEGPTSAGHTGASARFPGRK